MGAVSTGLILSWTHKSSTRSRNLPCSATLPSPSGRRFPTPNRNELAWAVKENGGPLNYRPPKGSPMITEEEVISILRHYFPEPTWKVWVRDPGTKHLYKYAAVKTIIPINEKTYGWSFSLIGLETLVGVERLAKQYSDELRASGVVW